MKSTVKSVMLVAAFVFAVSCTKSSPESSTLRMESSSVVPCLTISEGTPMNLIEMSGSTFESTFTFNCNVPFITGGYNDEQNGFGFSVLPVDNGDVCQGTTKIKIGRGAVDYTRDVQNTLVESPFTGIWTNYCGDGPLEIVFTTRVRGSKGTSYIDFSNVSGTAVVDYKKTTYAKGEIVAISDVVEGSEKASVYASKCWQGYFPQLGDVNFSAEYVTITLSDGEHTIDVNVMGKKRESEISRLLEYVSEGDMIELPVTMRKDGKVIDTVVASSVLKLK